MRTSRLGDQFFVLWVYTVRSDRIKRTVVQAKAAQIELLIKEVRKFGCPRKHRERRAYSKDKRLGSQVAEKKAQSLERRARGQNGRDLHIGEFSRKIRAVNSTMG